MDEKENGQLETWAIVEVMGHSRYAGFVRQVPMGGAAMIRVDVPDIKPRQRKRRKYDYEKDGYVDTDEIEVIEGMPAYTKFLGVSAIFAITPCTEETARAAVEQFRSEPATVLSLPTHRALPSPDSISEDDDEQDNVSIGQPPF